MMKNPLTYEIMTPQSVGVPDSKLVLGKHSGRAALNLHCQRLGYNFDRRQLDVVYRRFVELADRIKIVDESNVLVLIHQAHPEAERNFSAIIATPANIATVSSTQQEQNFAAQA